MDIEQFSSILLQQNILLMEQCKELTKAVNLALSKVPTLGVVSDATTDSSESFNSSSYYEDEIEDLANAVVILPSLSEDEIAQLERDELGQFDGNSDEPELYDTAD